MKNTILGVKIDSLTFNEVLAKAAVLVEMKKPSQIVTVNPEFVLEAQKDPNFKKIINSAEIATPDGFGLMAAGWYLSQRFEQRITGVDLTWALCRLAASRDYSVFFLGGVEGVAKKAAQKVKKIFPELKIAGTHSGSPDELNTYEILEKTKPDILLVAFGAPKQEKFIYGLLNPVSDLGFRISNFKSLCIGVGGTFDYIAGVVPYAPKWMRKIGLEWLYRLFTQDDREARIFRAVIVFPWKVFWSRFKKS